MQTGYPEDIMRWTKSNNHIGTILRPFFVIIEHAAFFGVEDRQKERSTIHIFRHFSNNFRISGSRHRVMDFQIPINFVAPKNAIWPELRSWDGTAIDPATLSKRSGGILHSWILRTYYQLRLAGYPADLSSTPRAGAINFVSVRDFGRRQKRSDAFTVIPQGDAHDAMLADFRIFQNGLHAATDTSAVIWHWPQPGILPRDPARGDTMTNLAYKGRVLNLDPAFRSDAFLDALARDGFTFEIDAYEGLRGDHSWNDYRTADAVLAVRNLTIHDARKKPASKLINAWFAETPAILGPEPPFQELRQSNHDFIQIRTPLEAIEAVRALRNTPDLYRLMVETGRKRRAAFTEEALTRLWVDTITGPIMQAYERWSNTSPLRRRWHSARGIFSERSAKARDRALVRDGPRLLDGTHNEAISS